MNFGTCETKVKKVACEFIKPLSRGLFDAMERFTQLAHLIKKLRVFEAWWLFYVDLLSQISVEKHIGHIQLVDEPIDIDGNGQQKMNSCDFDHRAESFMEVNALLLVKALGN